ncbi:hypothetical protein F4778DRAFT_756960 [Xylariomycetidae sp. FL2044]|nr:hypothetical protein F4778DRAFT_756960 [Xylariomycetidae sp. FL2044]
MATPTSGTSVPRRSHPKSRTGCKTCKSRKIKCDEQKPACRNCLKHHVDCDFLTVESPSTPGPRSLPDDLKMADLELLHNYTTSTYATLSESVVLREFYRMSAVQMSLSCDYNMRALLAVSALQLAHYRPRMRDYYQSLAMTHHQIASRSAMALMSDINPSTAPNLFLFSVLTIFYAFGCPRKEEGSLLIGETGFPDWMFLLQGTYAITSVLGVQSEGLLAPLFNHGIERFIAREDNSNALPAHQHLESLRELISRRELDKKLTTIYLDAIEELKKSFSLFDPRNNSRRDLTDAFVWIHMVVVDFIPLLRDPLQEAVAIFAFWCVLLKRLENQWWLHGWANHLIAKSFNLLDEEHRLWIRWPIEEIGWVP